MCYSCNMQQMQDTSDDGPEACAALVLDVVPLIMRRIRTYMRAGRAADLSVPQFRALAFLNTHPGVTLSDVAEHVGLTLPAASRMIDGLVARGYAERRLSSASRRCVELRLSPSGEEMLQITVRHAENALAGLLAPLAPEERGTVMAALATLRVAFTMLPGAGGDGIDRSREQVEVKTP
ncbi:MAG: MarR family transcriptional regulator [Chloroflexi bacterium]|nr:MAG: MarR family transcriptional regulator [Chloroflexota bacterium]